MGVIVKERETKSLGGSSCFLSLLRLLLGVSIVYGGKTGPFKLDSGLQDFETGINRLDLQRQGLAIIFLCFWSCFTVKLVLGDMVEVTLHIQFWNGLDSPLYIKSSRIFSS